VVEVVVMAQLYRCYDARQVLLYIGISLRTLRRLSEHRRRAQWWQSTAHVTIENFDTWEQARAAEKTAIMAEHPQHNLADVPLIMVDDRELTVAHLRRQLSDLETEIAHNRREIEMLLRLLCERRPWWRRWFR
jgi:predicted GIY-YIG superfamily endonuclease